MGYFLIADKEIIKYSSNFDKVLKTLADMYGDRISIEYYGLITKDEILSVNYPIWPIYQSGGACGRNSVSPVD